ncbi:hypothetical protein [Chryseobacterium binzhouense]|uniref:hypothetical protein n=1 Tax=Chryseobacterium binzhouense TaxID=2593646 RepID=UPI00117DADD7|nr:hypothetical protein [Chryseobacterium binzhouense]
MIEFPNPNSPCSKVKAQFANENYKNKVATINKNYNFNLKKETGFSENKDGTFVDLLPSANNKSDVLTITFDQNTKGYTHVHVNDKTTSDLTPEGFMLSSDGTYVIKFTGTAADIKMGFDTEYWRVEYKNYFDKYFDRDNETNLLLFMKNKMLIQGVSLYKVKPNGKVSEYKLNTTQTNAEPIECGN